MGRLVKKVQENKTIEDLAWEIFLDTGHINYYLLFNALRNDRILEYNKLNKQEKKELSL